MECRRRGQVVGSQGEVHKMYNSIVVFQTLRILKTEESGRLRDG